MTKKPILFNTEMVRAILAGRKTVTRRVVKPQPRAVYFDGGLRIDDDETFLIADDKNGRPIQIVPQYSPGDILWVRETFRVDYLSNIVGSGRVHYKADGSFGDLSFQPARYDMMRRAQLKPGWRPNENMPKEAARIFLRVTDVRVERLQEMHIEDSLREGVKLHLERCLNGEAPLKPFADLWDSTIKSADRGRYGWAANPWVWVIEFERCEKPEKGDNG